MDTAQLKKFAQEARKSLMGTVEAKLGVVLAEDSLARRESKSAVSALEGLINEIGKDQVIEKVAYTWFNRFCALRFMDANHYNKIGIVSPVEGQTQPEILAEAKMGYYDDSVVDAKNKDQINKLLNTSQDDAYKLLLVSYCNFLNKQLPFMFERINDYTELLMPDDLLSTNSVLSQTVAVLDKETCKDVEVIGWLYQYYITDLNELVYDGNMSKKRISKELLPAATQLFTPKWAVQYMVENSLGRLWLESHPDENFKSKLKYYLENKQDNDNATSENIKPQDIKILDPACGSGHILVVAFSILFEIYKSQGWQENEIPEMILKNNLYGLDICDRATQLSQFAVMMKAREYDRNIFNKVSELNICSIKDTNWLDNLVAQELMKGVSDENQAKEQIKLLQDTFKDAKEYGSIIDVRDFDFDFWNERINYFNQGGQMSMYTPIIKGRLRYSIKQAKIMQQKYDVAVTNPPYLSNSRMSQKLSDYITSHYKDEKSDFCAVFYKKMAESFARNNGFISLITTNSWMFLKSFEPLRNYAINNLEFESLVDYGTELFEGKVGHNPIVAWVNKKTKPTKKLLAVRLVDFCYSRREEKKTEFFNKDNYYISDQKQFSFIPGMPIAYWASEKVKELFKNEKKLSEIASPKQGMATSDNNRFLRFWNEVSISNIGFNYKSRDEAKESKLRWFPYNKGGAYRKWYGNNENVVDWSNDGYAIINSVDENGKQLSRPQNVQFFFNKSISWSKISSSDLSMRFFDNGFLFDVAGCSIFTKDENILKYVLGFTNSSVVKKIIKSISSTLNYEVGQISSLPLITEIDDNLKNTIINKVNECISISKKDWDSFENSWDFKIHPLLKHRSNFSTGLANYDKPMYFDKMQNGELREADWTPNDRIEECFVRWQEEKEKQFKTLKDNEEELNRLFIEIYGLQDEMDNKVDNKDITLKGATETEKDCIKSLLSYAVGCMFGRYSLDKEGLVFAGGEFNKNNYKLFEADDDGIIPILSEHYFSDDITERFKKFLKVAFGETYYEENMDYIASVLGKKTNETADDTIRNYFLKDFYNDHVKLYQKRPIYWLFSSKNGNFNALIYLHRYNKDTVNRILNNYLREYEGKLEQSINNNKHILTSGASDRDKSKAQKEIETAQKIVSEVKDYERDVIYPLATERKEIDLDDGVKVNYLKFGKALKNIGLKA